MNKIGVIVAVFIAGFLALIAYTTVHGPRYRAEVCMSFADRSTCKTVSAKSEQAAERAGVEGACADIAFGVTDTMRCIGSEPKSVRWLARPKP